MAVSPQAQSQEFGMRTLLAVVAAAGAAVAGYSQEKPKPGPLAGVWKVVSTAGHGKVVSAAGNSDEFGRPLWGDTTFTVAGDRLTTKSEPVVLPSAQPDVGLYFAIHGGSEYRLKLSRAVPPRPGEIDLVLENGAVLKGVYELKGDELRLCFVNWLALPEGGEKAAKAAAAVPRPTTFETKDGTYVSYVLKRAKE